MDGETIVFHFEDDEAHRQEDAEFIVHARADIEWLLAECDRRAQLDGCGQHGGVMPGTICGECMLERAENAEAECDRLSRAVEALKNRLRSVAPKYIAGHHPASPERAGLPRAIRRPHTSRSSLSGDWARHATGGVRLWREVVGIRINGRNDVAAGREQGMG